MLYPGLESFPQAELARRQMTGGSSLIAFRVGGGRERAFAVLNRLRLIKISNNLGDAKSLMTHPASTTHSKIAAAERLSVGITEDLLRLSVGLEDVEDLMADLDQALGWLNGSARLSRSSSGWTNPPTRGADLDRTMIVEGGTQLQHHALGQQRDDGVQPHRIVEQPAAAGRRQGPSTRPEQVAAIAGRVGARSGRPRAAGGPR